MSALALKEYLLHIVNQVDENTTLEDVYKLLALYSDMETSEEQIQNQETFTQQEVEDISKSWLK